MPGGYGPALLMPSGGLPVPASLRAGETSRILSRTRDGKRPFGGYPSPLPSRFHCANTPWGVSELEKSCGLRERNLVVKKQQK